MKKGFTLIELLAVIVVLAILALVVTPIVLNIVENAQTGADERSLEGYAKVLQTTFYDEKMKETSLTLEDFIKNVDVPSTENEGVTTYTLTYSGNKVECPVEDRKVVPDENGSLQIELYNCIVNGRGPYNFVDGKAEKVEEIQYFDASKLTYTDMEVVYFDVKNNIKGCTNYHEDNSKTGYNGLVETKETENQTSCLKFYKYAEDSTTQTMILDHNTTATVAWNSSRSNASGPSTSEEELLGKLKADTAGWNGTIAPLNYSMDQSSQTSKAKYTVDYSEYKARLITANEIAMITGKTGWDETAASYSGFYYFHDLSNDYTTGGGDVCASTRCKYGWLYDRTFTSCTTTGCLNNSNVATYGYWTVSSNANNSSNAWNVLFSGIVSDYNVSTSSYNGVRPVITISKS